ncbi:MAG: T9SS type A sorting domain-containing protein [Candidatus Cloacimonetes bacterium]|nr:T9SS type A sorting domain-containing protein [Candidatus Cloacimonadota bacterium]
MPQRCIIFCFVIALLSVFPLYAQPQLEGELHIDSVQGYIIQMHLDVSNVGNETFSHTFGDSEVCFYSIDGNEYHDMALPIVLPFSLEPGATYTFNLTNLYPLSSGSHSIQAYLNVMDNEGNPMPMGVPQIVVIPNSTSITIGAGDALSRIPIDFYWRTTLYQCIFSAEELNHTSGWISSLSFYNNFSQETFSNQQIRIYLTHVTQNDLAEDWVEPNMVPVFYGFLNFPTGENEIVIPLSSGFYYDGSSNLAMMVHRPIPESYQMSSDPFLVQAANPLRSRKYTSDSTTLYPGNPPAPDPSQHVAFMPKTTFQIIPNPSGNNDEHAIPSAIVSSLYPNPVFSECTIKISNSNPEPANLEIFNLRGQKIRNLNSPVRITDHILHWDTKDSLGKPCPSGIYFYRVSSRSSSISKKLILIRQ